MKDFPLNDLLSATDLPKIANSINAIFRHVSTKLKLSPYPIRRALPLVEAISRDFNDALLRVLGTGKLMFMGWEAFEGVMKDVGEVFAAWDENMKEFTGIARDRACRLPPISLAPSADLLRSPLPFFPSGLQSRGSAPRSSSRSRFRRRTPSCRSGCRTCAASASSTSSSRS